MCEQVLNADTETISFMATNIPEDNLPRKMSVQRDCYTFIREYIYFIYLCKYIWNLFSKSYEI